MNYKQLSQQYRDDTLAEAMYAREVEYFHYEFDKQNFEALLKGLADGERRTDILGRLSTTILQMEYLDDIYNALEAQITNQEAHTAAILRTTEKRNKTQMDKE
jgi:hypothetical protein